MMDRKQIAVHPLGGKIGLPLQRYGEWDTIAYGSDFKAKGQYLALILETVCLYATAGF